MVFCSVASSNEYILYATWDRHILPASCAIRSKWEESVEASTYDKPLCTLLVNVKQSTFCCSDCKHTQHDRNRKKQQAETRHCQTQMYNTIALSLGVSTRQNWNTARCSLYNLLLCRSMHYNHETFCMAPNTTSHVADRLQRSPGITTGPTEVLFQTQTSTASPFFLTSYSAFLYTSNTNALECGFDDSTYRIRYRAHDEGLH